MPFRVLNHHHHRQSSLTESEIDKQTYNKGFLLARHSRAILANSCLVFTLSAEENMSTPHLKCKFLQARPCGAATLRLLQTFSKLPNVKAGLRHATVLPIVIKPVRGNICTNFQLRNRKFCPIDTQTVSATPARTVHLCCCGGGGGEP